MMDGAQIWKAVVAAVGTAATYLWGGWDAALTALVLVITLDYLTGVAAAWRQKTLNSEKGAHGLLGKVGILILVALAHVLDGLIGSSEPVLRTATIYWYIANEALSIDEGGGLQPAPPRLRSSSTCRKSDTCANGGSDFVAGLALLFGGGNVATTENGMSIRRAAR